MHFMFWIWLSVIVVAVIVELCTMDLSSIWFALAGVVALILSIFPLVFPWWAQLIVFAILSLTLLLFLRRIAKKFLNRKSDGKTNMDLLTGKHIRMLTRFDFETLGTAKVNGVEWSVRAEDDTVLEKDDVVEVIGVDGNKLVVKKV